MIPWSHCFAWDSQRNMIKTSCRPEGMFIGDVLKSDEITKWGEIDKFCKSSAATMRFLWLLYSECDVLQGLALLSYNMTRTSLWRSVRIQRYNTGYCILFWFLPSFQAALTLIMLILVMHKNNYNPAHPVKQHTDKSSTDDWWTYSSIKGGQSYL